MKSEEILGSVLITGGTGTFGNALCRYILDDNLAKTITIFSRDEDKQFHMKKKFPEVHFHIGSVRDEYALARAMRGVDTVFHAAALKHVPTGEVFPEEVIETNINGIRNVLNVADVEGISRVVNLSSDKSVQPVNAYGMTKGLSEKLVAAHQGRSIGVSLRYGNVIGSRGSVIPLFINQFLEGDGVTVTNKNMTRFLLPINKAIELAVFCAVEPLIRGSIVVIKSPACTVSTLVEAIGRHIYGKFANYENLNTKEIGIRPGEKIHEILLTKEEVARGVFNNETGICVVPPSLEKSNIDFSEYEEFTSANTEQYNSKQVFELLKANGIFG